MKDRHGSNSRASVKIDYYLAQYTWCIVLSVSQYTATGISIAGRLSVEVFQHEYSHGWQSEWIMSSCITLTPIYENSSYPIDTQQANT